MTTIKLVLAWILSFLRAPFAPFAGPTRTLTVGPTWTQRAYTSGTTRRTLATYNAIRRLQARPDYCALVKARDRRVARSSRGSRAVLAPVDRIAGFRAYVRATQDGAS